MKTQDVSTIEGEWTGLFFFRLEIFTRKFVFAFFESYGILAKSIGGRAHATVETTKPF